MTTNVKDIYLDVLVDGLVEAYNEVKVKGNKGERPSIQEIHNIYNNHVLNSMNLGEVNVKLAEMQEDEEEEEGDEEDEEDEEEDEEEEEAIESPVLPLISQPLIAQSLKPIKERQREERLQKTPIKAIDIEPLKPKKRQREETQQKAPITSEHGDIAKPVKKRTESQQQTNNEYYARPSTTSTQNPSVPAVREKHKCQYTDKEGNKCCSNAYKVMDCGKYSGKWICSRHRASTVSYYRNKQKKAESSSGEFDLVQPVD